MHALFIIPGLWLLFFVSWILAGAWTNRTVKRPSIGAEIPYRILLWLGIILLFVPRRRIYPHLLLGRFEFHLLLLLMLLGFAFCWWARLHLGKLWSGSVTLKADHRLVDTGPYAIVRHPIYTGLILALLATAIAKASFLGWAGTGLIIIACWLKAHVEENWLRSELGTETYDSYRRRVPMLIPFGPKAR